MSTSQLIASTCNMHFQVSRCEGFSLRPWPRFESQRFAIQVGIGESVQSSCQSLVVARFVEGSGLLLITARLFFGMQELLGRARQLTLRRSSFSVDAIYSLLAPS